VLKSHTLHFCLDRRWCLSSSDFGFHPCPRFSFLGESGGCLDCASTALDVGAQFFPAAPRSFQNTAPRSFLQHRVLFSSAYARRCDGWRWLAGEMRMQGVCGPPVAHPSSRRFDSFLCLGVIPDSRRAVPMRLPFTSWARFIDRVFPDLNQMHVPIT
jgi:hypothetical protein